LLGKALGGLFFLLQTRRRGKRKVTGRKKKAEKNHRQILYTPMTQKGEGHRPDSRRETAVWVGREGKVDRGGAR